ncbi:hypothetical protein J26TS2_22370 [Shouchella clausii]|nr:hypothetical protein J26TS2_22370 [Shouchella clausii]
MFNNDRLGKDKKTNMLKTGVKKMLWTIIVIILVLWLLGLIADIGGGLINLLLIVALVVFIFQMLNMRKGKS